MLQERIFRPYRQKTGVAISKPTELFHPQFVAQLDQRLGNRRVRVSLAEHDNLMPRIYVGPAERIALVTWINGGNLDQAMRDVVGVGCAFTHSPDQAGGNTEELTIVLPYAEFRGHRRRRNPVPDREDEKAIVRAEGLNNIPIIRAMAHVARARRAVTVDSHNPWETGNQFQKEDLEFVNLTPNQIYVDYLKANGLLTDEFPTVVFVMDIGNLPSALDFSTRLREELGIDHLPLAINLKTRLQEHHDVVDHIIKNDAEIQGSRVIIADDMISSGGSVKKLITDLLEKGASEVILFATHAVFVKDYYEKLEGLLKNPRVKIFVTDSLPFVRDGKDVAIPYSGENQVQIIPIADWLAQKVATLLDRDPLQTAAQALQSEILKPRDPYHLLFELTGKEIKPPKDVGVYEEGGRISFFSRAVATLSPPR